MATLHKILSGFQFVSAFFALAAGSLASAQVALPANARTVLPENKVPGQIESTARRLMHQLDKQGYEILRGYFKLYTKDDCDMSYSVMHTCYANNPAAPYVLPLLPAWPDKPGPGEWVDPATIGAFGETVNGYNGSYRLDPREAIVILGQMPPPAAYFGLKTYLFTRPGEVCTQSDTYSFVEEHIPALFPVFFSLVPKEPENSPRVEIIADLSNSPNNVIIANKSGSVWNQLRYFVITPNPGMDAAIRSALSKIGIADEDIFTEKIPASFPSAPPPLVCPDASTIHFGLGQQADDFATVIRYALPVDDTAAGRWRQRLPLVVLRIRNVAADVQTYPWEDFEPRTPTDPPETSYKSDLDTLTQAICTSWNTTETTQNCTGWNSFLNMQPLPLHLTGPACAANWMNCLAPNEDTTYEMSPKLPLDPDHFYAVAGPLGTATNNATYVSLGLNSSINQLGFDEISAKSLTGSADGYSSAVPADKFFVQYFARDCSVLAAHFPGGGAFHCYSIQDKFPYCYNALDLNCNMLVLSLRGYLRPGTQRGSDPNSVLNSRFIFLEIPKP